MFHCHGLISEDVPSSGRLFLLSALSGALNLVYLVLCGSRMRGADATFREVGYAGF
jgi:hypothetical protein